MGAVSARLWRFAWSLGLFFDVRFQPARRCSADSVFRNHLSGAASHRSLLFTLLPEFPRRLLMDAADHMLRAADCSRSSGICAFLLPHPGFCLAAYSAQRWSN